MKSALMVAIALFMVATIPMMAVEKIDAEKNLTTVADGNVVDKLIALIEGYTSRITAVETETALDSVYCEFKKSIAEFPDKYATEIAVFDKNITAEQAKAYENALHKAVEELENAVGKKAGKILGE